jgi:polyhydroxyalkanoate synthesis regulator phasin
MATKSGGSKSTGRGAGKAKRPKAGGKAKGSRSATSAGRSDKSVQAFREALDRSRSALESNVTISRERIDEVVDDAVERGRMTRGDANELVSKLVDRSRKATDDLMRDLEKLLEQARKEVESRTAAAGRQASRTAERVGRSVRDVADRPLAEADKLRRRAGGPGGPITGYEQLTANQIKARLKDLSPAELRKVRTQENRGKARKGVLKEIDRRLAK